MTRVAGIETPYLMHPRFLLSHQTRPLYYRGAQGISLLDAWIYDLPFVNDSEESSASQKKGFFKRHPWVVVGGVSIVLLAIAGSENQNTAPIPGTSSIQTSAGLSQSDAEGQSAVIDRYQLDSYAKGVVADDAAEVYAMESSTQYGAALQVAGVGSLNDITDTLAHIAQAWSLSDANISHSLDVIFNGLTTSSISWKDYTDALITNGPVMQNYTSLADAASFLAASENSIGTQDTLGVFNTMGEELADPNTQLNIAMGGVGSVRTLVKREGFVNAVAKG
jgi:hypothetical protein